MITVNLFEIEYRSTRGLVAKALLHVILRFIKRLSETEFSVFVYLIHFLLPMNRSFALFRMLQTPWKVFLISL